MAGKDDQGRVPDGDDLLLAAYAAGDPAAPRAMADRFTAPAFRLALRMLGDHAEAEDVTQEALIRLFGAAPGWRPGTAKVTSWLYRVTANPWTVCASGGLSLCPRRRTCRAMICPPKPV